MARSHLPPVWASCSYHTPGRLKTNAPYGVARRPISAGLLPSAEAPRQWVGRFDELAHALIQNMGVYLRRRDIGVAQHLLQRPQICTICQQVAGESMADYVWADPLRLKTTRFGMCLQQLSETLARQMTLRSARRK